MDSSPDLSVKLRRGSSDSRDSFYMGFAQGIDSDIEEVTTVQNVPPPPIPTTSYPVPEEPPLELPASVEVLSEPEEFSGLPDDNVTLVSEQQKSEEDDEENIQLPDVPSLPLEPAEIFLGNIPPPPFLPDEDEDTNTSVTVIQSKNKTPSSSSSSISSALNELTVDESRNFPPPTSDSPKSRQQSVEAEIVSTPPSHKSPPMHRSPPSIKSSPPRRLNLHKERRVRNFDSDSVESINAMDCKIDDDNRDDSSPTDSMPPAPTPPPLGFPLSLEKR